MNPFLLRFFLARAVVGFAVVSAVVVMTQDLQIFPGAAAALMTQKGVSPDRLPEGVEGLFLTTVDGQRLESWRVGRELASGPIALLFHGNAETVESLLDLQRALLGRGIESYSLDYRGYGRSTGWPSEQGLYRDVEALVAHVREHHDLTNRPLVLWGSSLGTGFAAYASTLVPSNALVLVAPYANLRRVVRETPFFGFLASFAWYEVPTEQFVAATQSGCIIALHGLRDRVILPDHTLKLVEASKPSVRFHKFLLPEANHDDILGRGFLQLENALEGCVARKP